MIKLTTFLRSKKQRREFEYITKAVDRRSIASSVRADVNVVSLLLRASLRISMYAPVM